MELCLLLTVIFWLILFFFFTIKFVYFSPIPPSTVVPSFFVATFLHISFAAPHIAFFIIILPLALIII